MNINERRVFSELIEACGKNGVVFFKTDKVEIHFAGYRGLESVFAVPEMGPEMGPQINYKEENDLHITDPLAFEEQLAREEDDENGG